MTVAVLLFVIAALAIALFLLLVRSDRSRDGRTFAWIVMIDGAVAALTAGYLVRDRQLDEPGSQLVGLFGALALAHLTLELAWSFPRDLPTPSWLRYPSLAITGVGYLLALHPVTSPTFTRFCTIGYFVPYFVVTVVLMARNARAMRGTPAAGGINIVLAAIVFRWIVGIGTYMVAKRLGSQVFLAALHFERSGAMLIGWLLFGYALLRYRLFRIRGVVAELVVYGGLVLSVLGLVVLGLEVVLDRLRDPVLVRAGLLLLTLVPVAAAAIGRRLLPALEERVLGPLDPRRTARRGLLERVLSEMEIAKEPGEVLVLVKHAVHEMTGGGSARFLCGPAFAPTCSPRSSMPSGSVPGEGGTTPPSVLSETLATHLAALVAPYVHRSHAAIEPALAAELDRLDAELVVPLRRGKSLYGALVVSGGTIDRETAALAVAVAGHFAVKLENDALLGQTLTLRDEIEDNRRLVELGAFAAAIAHDIRTPLTSIQMNVQILRSKVSLPPDDMEHFDIALDELRRLNASVAELLDFAKPVALARRSVAAKELVDVALRGLEPILDERRLTLERNDEPDVPPVLADLQRMRQVLVNLVDNAAQASADGGAITLGARRETEGRVALDVIDHGRGISVEALPRIFDPFYTTRPDGTGLGLAIAQKLVRAHGGEIRVSSTPGEGSCFTVLLPVAHPPASP